MAELTVQKISLTGLEPEYVAAASGGDTFKNNGNTYLCVKNGGGSAVTVTIDSIVLSNYGTDVDIAVSVPASEERLIGPFNKARFNNAVDIVNVTYSAITSVTVGAITFDDNN
jgi:hypothetical protein